MNVQIVEKAEDLIDSIRTQTPFVTLDSGKREEFETGARRDVRDGKTMYSLIPLPPLKRLADLYTRGAQKYGMGNWTKGMPFSRVFDSLDRHLREWALGDRSEDHLAAVSWNCFTLMAYEHMIEEGRLERRLDDMSGKSGILDG